MFKRIALMTALLVAPLALSPDSVDAQERGMEQATAATANAQATGRPDAPPPGMDNRSGEALPPGILLTREPPAEDSGTESEPEECLTEPQLVDGQWVLVDCHGNVIG